MEAETDELDTAQREKENVWLALASFHGLARLACHHQTKFFADINYSLSCLPGCMAVGGIAKTYEWSKSSASDLLATLSQFRSLSGLLEQMAN